MNAPMHRCMITLIIMITLFVVINVLAAPRVLRVREMQFYYSKQCQGKFNDKVPTPEELKKVLDEHALWTKKYLKYPPSEWLGVPWQKKYSQFQHRQSDHRKANLCGAILILRNLSGADLAGADLSGADLTSANLSGAVLAYANLSGANLIDANLSGANMSHVNLKDATLSGANLSGAVLQDAHLDAAEFRNANLSGVIFEPQELPHVDFIVDADNLSQMVYEFSPQAMVKLREGLKESGYYQQERELTCAIQRSNTWLLPLKRNLEQRPISRITSLIEAGFRYVFFDLTCQWGSAPGRPILILFFLILLFANVYAAALVLPGQDGIWRKWADDRIRLDLGTKKPERLYLVSLKVILIALYFSLLSAANIGWREINIGNWIQRIQSKEYTLKATGWVRTISGIQSIISIYLIVLWALTYFGRPFE